MRQIVLDTETTGLEPSEGHKIIEIGCVELVNRRLTGRHYHQYLNPGREVEQGAIDVHGITNEFLADKPLFESVVQAFLEFVQGAELIIHNAPFDVGFLNHELRLLDASCPLLDARCKITDSLMLARNKHPGQRNNLDALCKRYEVDNSGRDLHGALLDAEILADVYLAMTGGQVMIDFGTGSDDSDQSQAAHSDIVVQPLSSDRAPLVILKADEAEVAAHLKRVQQIESIAGQTFF